MSDLSFSSISQIHSTLVKASGEFAAGVRVGRVIGGGDGLVGLGAGGRSEAVGTGGDRAWAGGAGAVRAARRGGAVHEHVEHLVASNHLHRLGVSEDGHVVPVDL